jgi:hypothetical protein
MEAHPRVVEISLEVDTPGAIEAQFKAIEAHPGTVEALD